MSMSPLLFRRSLHGRAGLFLMFGLGPAYLFILRHRLPIGVMCGGCQPWLSTMATNAAIAALVAIVI